MDLSDEFGNDENYCINRDHRDRAKKYNIKVPHIVSVISDAKYQKKFLCSFTVDESMVIISSKELAEEFKKQSECSGKNTKKHRTFLIPIKNETETYKLK